MRIAIDAIGIHYPGGGRTASLNLLQNLFKIDAENHYLVFLSQEEPSLKTLAGNVEQYIVPLKNRFGVRVFAQMVIPFRVRGYNLVHFTKHLGLFGPLPPYIVTVHDLTTILYPNVVPWFDHLYWRTLQAVTVQNARLVTTGSQNTAKDLERIYHIAPSKIRVIHYGCAEFFKPSPEEEIRRVRQKYQAFDPYIVHVGRIDLKKNLTVLVKAFDLLKKRAGFQGKLVLVGEEYKKSLDLSLRPAIEELGLQKEVVFTGRVPDQDLPPLYSGALFCVYPSVHEGFGLAQLEALTCGCPIIAHQAGAVAEVVGDAGIILERIDVDEIAEQMKRLADDPDLRDTFRQRGLERAKGFSWQSAAEKLLAIYQEAAG